MPEIKLHSDCLYRSSKITATLTIYYVVSFFKLFIEGRQELRLFNRNEKLSDWWMSMSSESKSEWIHFNCLLCGRGRWPPNFWNLQSESHSLDRTPKIQNKQMRRRQQENHFFIREKEEKKLNELRQIYTFVKLISKWSNMSNPYELSASKWISNSCNVIKDC